MKTKCFFRKDGEHEYDEGSKTCRLCGEVKKRGQGLYRRNKKADNYKSR